MTLSITIPVLDTAAMEAARQRQALLTKPVGSLGRLETLSIQLAGMTATPRPTLTHKAIIVMAGDHGVAAEHVSAFPSEVTTQMVLNFLRGGAAINVIARSVGARVVIVDMGIKEPLPPQAGLISVSVGRGTANIAQGAAMRREAAMRAINAGIAIVHHEIERGLNIVAVGDMGIANTTASAAIACALMGVAPDTLVGRGTGIDDAGLARKVAVVRRALAVNTPNASDGLEVLSKVGGFEIGGMAGVMLGAAARRVPVVLDGFISTAAAMIAAQIAPAVKAYLIPSHCSEEQGHALMLGWLGLEPLFDYGMRLGEGVGAALAFPTLEVAARLLDEMATFGEAGVSGKTE